MSRACSTKALGQSRTAKRSILTHHLLPTLGSKRLDEIMGKDVKDLKASLLAKGKSAKRINNVLNVLSKIMRYAAEIKLLDRTPRIKTLKVPPQRFDFFTSEEFERLVASSAEEPDWHAAVLWRARRGFGWGRCWRWSGGMSISETGSSP